MPNIAAVVDNKLSTKYEKRFVIIDKTTGQILDDAQGYGYKSAQKAYAAYAYKNRDRSKDADKKKKIRLIRKWMKEHPKFVRAMDEYAFQIAKGSWSPDDKFDAKFVKKMLSDYGYEVEFTPGELLKVWRNE